MRDTGVLLIKALDKMNKKEILKACEKNKKQFEKIIKDVPYSEKGIFNSEMLLFVSIVKALNVKTIIESGRALGQSTEVICRFFNDKKYSIYSIELNRYSKDVAFAEKRLKNYSNLKLLYGDSNSLIFKLIRDKCAILIDGPKGEEAILLAIKLLRNPKVKLIFIHDLHKNTFDRNIAEILFNNIFFSDDEDFVKKFKELDKNCWEKLKGTGEAPYLRKGKKINSYASTLAVIFNQKNSLNFRAIKNYLEYSERKRETLLRKIVRVLRKSPFFLFFINLTKRLISFLF